MAVAAHDVFGGWNPFDPAGNRPSVTPVACGIVVDSVTHALSHTSRPNLRNDQPSGKQGLSKITPVGFH